ncbi:hypothetical protein NMG60_11021735 [Bertholletia excelsa]
MPALLKYHHDGKFCSGGSIYSTDYGLLCSVASHLDVYYPPSKRAKISSPFSSSGELFGKERTPSIQVLPDECLYEIFRRLPEGQARSASACVSKRWLHLLSSIRNFEICRKNTTENGSATSKGNESPNDIDVFSGNENMDMESDGYLTRSLDGKKATDIRLAAIAVGTSSRGGLGKLSIRGSNPTRGVTNVGLAAIARGCPSLRSLSMWNVPSIGDEGILEIAKECHLLEKLDLCQCPLISNKGLIAIAENSPNLTMLTIEACQNIGNVSLQAIARCCPKLQCITIKDCPSIGDQGVASLVSSASSVLTKLKLQSLSITDFSLAVIGHYGKALTSLNLCGLLSVSEKGFWVMANAQGLDKLEFLSITSCRGTTDMSLEAIGKSCHKLKHLCLRKCCFLSDGGLESFTKASESLENLQLEECNRITLSGILHVLSNCGSKLKSLSLIKCTRMKDLYEEMFLPNPCESLCSLSIRSCPGFSDASLVTLGELCPQLCHIDLSGLCQITNAGFLSLVEGCKAGLLKVNLSSCLNVTDESILGMTRLHGETLEVVNLDGCLKLTDRSLAAIADNCLALSDLDVSKTSVTDAGLAALSCGWLNLQILSLSGCSKISNKSIPFLSKLGKTLVGLNIQSCNSISNSTIELLMDSLWRCDILY